VITVDGASDRIGEVIKRAQIAIKADYLRKASLTSLAFGIPKD
jgi:hypothetical protein